MFQARVQNVFWQNIPKIEKAGYNGLARKNNFMNP